MARSHVTREEVVFLVRHYLDAENFPRAHEAFVQESRHLARSVRPLRAARNLHDVLDEYVQLKAAEARRRAFAEHFGTHCAPLVELLGDLGDVLESYKRVDRLEGDAVVRRRPLEAPTGQQEMIPSTTTTTTAAPIDASQARLARSAMSPRKGRKAQAPRRVLAEEQAIDEVSITHPAAPATAPMLSLMHDDGFAARMALAINARLTEDQDIGQGSFAEELAEQVIEDPTLLGEAPPGLLPTTLAPPAASSSSSPPPPSSASPTKRRRTDASEVAALLGSVNVAAFLAEMHGGAPISRRS